ncbi:MAG TPA: hypothetical protein VGM17_08450 [Rhizomicrobium sp.]|jgi:hypothetical protein
MANLSANYLRKARNWDSYLPDASDLRRLTRSVGLSRGRDDSAHAALAVGFVAGAFIAVGALAIARVAIGKMAIGKLHLRELEIDDFTVHRIHNGSGAAISQHVEGDDRGLALPPEEALTKEDLSDHDEEQPAGSGKRSRGRKNGGRADRSD